jgi:hypothetical protein
MTLKEIREEAWDVAGDVSDIDRDRLWTETEMNRYINRTLRKICSDTLCLRDAETPEICLIDSAPVDYTTYVEGTLDYIWANDPDNWLYQQNVAPYLFDLDERILQIDEIKWSNRSWKLRKVSCQKWQKNPWWERVIGLPTEYATDLTNGKIALNFRDTGTDTLALVVKRMPLEDLVEDSDVPEIRTQYHDRILNGVLEKMYRKQDAETFNKVKAEEYRELFLDDIDFIKQEEEELNIKLNSNPSLSAFL